MPPAEGLKATVRAGGAAAGADVERRRVAGDRQRAQQERVEHLGRRPAGVADRAQGADEQQELLERRLPSSMTSRSAVSSITVPAV